MKLAGGLLMEGEFHIEHRNKDGVLKSWERIHNTVTSAGKAGAALVIQGSNNPAEIYKFIGLGSSATAATVSDTALAGEITSDSLKRVAGTASQATTNVSNDTSQILHTFSSTATQAVQEVGLFNSATVAGSTMMSRKTFTAKNLSSGDTLQVTHQMVFA